MNILTLIARRRRSIIRQFILTALALSAVTGNDINAQYFGRNKPGYRSFNHKVLQTPSFEIYHYLDNDSLLNYLSLWSENWYGIHQKTFGDSIKERNPLIFYNNHADFQQTNTISGLIGTGTGGVTEGLKNRVIMPIAPTLAQTNHTLGHELVHAFQFNMILNSDTMKRYSLNNVPLWMIEGMAEYLSLGSVDPNTAMWLRDALVNNDFPTIRQLSDQSKYFPYRYGHAFWAMAGKTWGDTIIMPLIQKTARYGFRAAVDSVLGFNDETLSGMWKSATEVHFNPLIEGLRDSLAGKMLISKQNAGRMNISPSISPDGKHIAFFSEKNLFTLDLFMADATTGKVIKKLSSVIKNTDIDDFSFIESAGTWSPDSKKFAFVIFNKGINKLAVVNVSRKGNIKMYKMKGIDSFSNPSWSPDGSRIVFTGMVDGISDLFMYNFDDGTVERLTGNLTSDIHPTWSSDGKRIVFSKEIINDAEGQKKFSFDLAILDLETKIVNMLDVFKGAYNMNPFFSKDGKYIYFLSDADGFRNLYKYDLSLDSVYRLTEYVTGISGITPYSPAISLAQESDLLVYTYYIKNSYQIWAASETEFKHIPVSKYNINFDAGTLPPLKHLGSNLVDNTLYNSHMELNLPTDSTREIRYRPKFQLDYISNNASVGVTTGIYRNNLAGSINMSFSDILGNNQMFASLSLNGEIYDFGGQAAYVNQKSKVKWGTALSHVPYRSGYMFLKNDTLKIKDELISVDNLVLDYIRMFEDNITGFAFYPISQNRRVEAGFSLSWYYYRIDRFNNYYLSNGAPLGSKREKLDAPDGSKFQQISLAYVEDNSFFGMTSPLQGHRARYQAEKYFGEVDFFTALLDYRRYSYIKPFSLAFRIYHYGRYGGSKRSGKISPIYLAYPWLVRGYEKISISGAAEVGLNSMNLSQLSGQRILVANAELRLPFSGPERLAMIKSKWLLTDLNLFFDSGVAWSSGDKIIFNSDDSMVNLNERFPVYSAGISLRINLLGALILEPYYAIPFQNGGFRNGVFGLSYTSGW